MKTEKLSDTITIINSDCREWSGVADAVISDPPYGMNMNTNSTRFKSPRKGCNKNWGPIVNDDKPFDPTPWLDFPVVVLWGINHFAARVPVGTTLVWIKRFDQAFGTFLSDAELAWMKGGCGVYCKCGPFPQSIAIDRIHPTQKPVELMLWCMDKAKVAPGAIVLDPYMGSGTTGVACIRTGRRFIGIEIDEHHYQTARQRLLNELAQTNLFRQDEDARAGQGECPGTACNSGRDAMPLDIFEGVQ